MTSYTRKLEHEVTHFIEKCDLKVPAGAMYIISFDIPEDGSSNAEELAQKVLTYNPEHAPLFVYCFSPRVYACYSGTPSNDCFMKGSIQSLVSQYSAYATKWTKTADYVSVRVTYFDTQPHVYAYLLWEMYILIRLHIHSLSKTITETEKTTLSISELTNKLRSEGIDWDKKQSNDKYGTFYKFKTSKGDKVIAAFSRRLDFNNYAADAKVIF